MQFGSQINPGYGNVDWSNFVNAGKMKAAGMQAIGQGIEGATASITDAIKQQKEQQKQDDTMVKAGELILNALEKTAPNMFDNVAEEKMFLANKEVPLSQRASRSMSWLQALKSGLALQQEQRLQGQLAYQIERDSAPPEPEPYKPSEWEEEWQKYAEEFGGSF